MKLQKRFRAQALTPLFVDDYGKTHENVQCTIFQLGSEDVQFRTCEEYVEIDDDLPEYASVFVQLPDTGNDSEFEAKNKGNFVKRATAAVGQSSIFKNETVVYKGTRTLTP